MSRVAVILAIPLGFLLNPKLAQAADIVSEYSLDAGGKVHFEEVENGGFDVTGGTVRVRFPAIGTRTPDPGASVGSILAVTLTHTGGKIVFGGMPLPAQVGGGQGFVTIAAPPASITATGTYNGFSFFATGTWLTLYAEMPALPIMGSVEITLQATGASPLGPIGKVYLGSGPVPGSEISRTFEPDITVPGPSALLLLSASAILFPIVTLLALRKKASAV